MDLRLNDGDCTMGEIEHAIRANHHAESRFVSDAVFTAHSQLPVELYRADQVREQDRIAIQEFGIPGDELMNRAGEAAFAVLAARWPASERVVVLCGGGNNGGDGYVVARLARAAGWAVEVYTPPGQSAPGGDARAACTEWLESGGKVEPFQKAALTTPAVVVDGLLGTGLEREVTGVYAEIIDEVNASGLPVLALDIPSGLSADTGMPLGVAVRAHTTMSFVGLKQGLFTGEAPDYVGDLLFADLGIPPEAYGAMEPSATRIIAPESHGLLKPRPRSAHKGSNGHVLIVGGDAGMSGAPRMAAEASARVGAGLVTVATRASHAAWINIGRPELMSYGVEDIAALKRLIERATVLAVGPGLGRGRWGSTMLETAVESGRPLVVDADGLNLLAADPRSCERWILTPHPGEAARLLGCSVSEIQNDRFAAVSALRQRYGGVIVLKGAGSLVCGDSGSIGVCGSGNPGMGSGGMGDVLSGVIAGLWAQGLEDPERVARVGVDIHGRAADLAAADQERGLLAADLYAHLRRLVNPSR